jgi:hypothetical protein
MTGTNVDIDSSSSTIKLHSVRMPEPFIQRFSTNSEQSNSPGQVVRITRLSSDYKDGVKNTFVETTSPNLMI